MEIGRLGPRLSKPESRNYRCGCYGFEGSCWVQQQKAEYLFIPASQFSCNFAHERSECVKKKSVGLLRTVIDTGGDASSISRHAPLSDYAGDDFDARSMALWRYSAVNQLMCFLLYTTLQRLHSQCTHTHAHTYTRS